MTGLRALQRFDRDRPWVLDTALGVALLAASLLSVFLTQPAPLPLHVALIVLGCLPYPARRRAPLAVLLIAGSVVLAIILLGLDTPVIGSGLFLLAYTVAGRCPLPRAIIGAGFCVALLATVSRLPDRMSLAELATNVALFVGAFALGRAARSHKDAAAAEAERATLAERARTEATRTALSEERLRIARELHDVVGHSLGVIALQAGVGARVAHSDPEEARLALVAIADRSRASLHEVRQILGALRGPDDETMPAPSLDDVPELVDRVSATGLTVELCTLGTPWPVSSSFGLTVYRLLQESLTNVVRHSGATRADVVLEWAPHQLTLSVTDDGHGARETSAPSGGQLGMRERVAIWNGTLTTGNSSGGYHVTATLPRPHQEDA